MLKKLLILITSLMLILSPMHSYAGGWGFLDSLFSGGSSVNQPGHYQSGARNSFSAGGLDIRVPRQAAPASFFTAQLPSFEFGCNGISAHFGGFSFIKAEELMRMIKQIASGVALGFVAEMGIKVICPMCEDLINKFREMAQLAARLARDACSIGRNLAKQAGISGKGSLTLFGSDNATDTCKQADANAGNADDTMATNSNCNSFQNAYNSMMKYINKVDPVQTAAISKKLGTGNVTWKQLTSIDNSQTYYFNSDQSYSRKLLYMNIMGVTVHYNGNGSDEASSSTGGIAYCYDGTDAGSKKAPKDASTIEYCKPTLTDSKELVGYLMCGTPKSMGADGKPVFDTASEAVLKYCTSFFAVDATSAAADAVKKDAQKKYIHVCDSKLNPSSSGVVEGTISDPDDINCAKVVRQPIDKALKIPDGLLFTIDKLLQYGVQQVISNKPLDTSSSGSMGKQLIALMNVAPYPIYQVINAAAVYPAAAADLLSSMSVLIAESLAVSQLNEMLKVSNANGYSDGGAVSPDEIKNILQLAEAMRSSAAATKTVIGQNLAIQQGINEQIRMVNTAIQKQVLSSEMLNVNSYAQNMNRAAISSSK